MHSTKSTQGSVLITALIFSAIIAISLTAYLRLALTTGKVANRSFYFNAAQNLADTGLEHTLWCLNNATTYTPPLNWTTGGFSDLGGNLYRATLPTVGSYTLSGGATGTVKVHVDNATGRPHVLARAIVTLGDGTTLSKTVEAYLQQRSWSNGGMISRTGMYFNGNVEVDSWISHGDDASRANDVVYSTAVRRAEGQIASPQLIAIQNADVYGRASIGTDDNSGITWGSTGRVGDFSAPPNYLDPNRVTYNFTASFPDVTPVPNNTANTSGTNLGTITTSIELPRTNGAGVLTGDVASGGIYYYYISSLTVNGAHTIAVGPPTAGVGSTNPKVKVVLVVTGNMTLGGTSQLVINPGSKLTIYSGGDINITGNTGIQNGGPDPGGSADPWLNMNMASDFTLLGTRTAAQIQASMAMQNWTLQGTSYLTAAIFGPNANITIGGTGDTFGSVVGNEVRMTGSGNFHQDESLANVRTSGLYQLMKWREITTAAELASPAVATPLAF
jgi:hypothetical protein